MRITVDNKNRAFEGEIYHEEFSTADCSSYSECSAQRSEKKLGKEFSLKEARQNSTQCSIVTLMTVPSIASV